MGSKDFADGADTYIEIYENLYDKLGLHPWETNWTFMCFMNAAYSTAQCTLVLLDAAARMLHAEGVDRAFKYYEKDGMGWLRSRKAFERHFEIEVRIKSAEYTMAELERWFFIEAHESWESVFTGSTTEPAFSEKMR